MQYNKNFHSLLIGVQNSTATLEQFPISYKAKHSFTIWPNICVPRYLHNLFENYVHRKTCMQIFIAALFTTAKHWKQLRYPSIIDEWKKNRSTCIHWKIIFKDLKKKAIRPWKGVNDPSVHTAEWKKPKGYIIPHLWHCRKSKIYRKKDQSLWGVWEEGAGFNKWRTDSFRAVRYLSDTHGRYMTPHICQNPQNFTAQRMNYTIYKF